MSIENLIIIILACRGNQLALSSEISTNLHLTRLRWVRNTEGAYRDSLLWYTHELVTKEKSFFYLIKQRSLFGSVKACDLLRIRVHFFILHFFASDNPWDASGEACILFMRRVLFLSCSLFLHLMMLLMKICAFAFFFVSFFCQLSPQVLLEKVVASNPCLKFHSWGGRRTWEKCS